MIRAAHANQITPFALRPFSFRGLREIKGWTLKAYAVSLPDELFDERAYMGGLELAAESLPQPPTAPGRLGVGFVIFHQTKALDYLVMGWWGRENEMPVRVYLRDRGEPDAAAWRPAQGDESFCVWDLEIIWHERNAWVQTLMAGGVIDAYLARVLNISIN